MQSSTSWWRKLSVVDCLESLASTVRLRATDSYKTTIPSWALPSFGPRRTGRRNGSSSVKMRQENMSKSKFGILVQRHRVMGGAEGDLSERRLKAGPDSASIASYDQIEAVSGRCRVSRSRAGTHSRRLRHNLVCGRIRPRLLLRVRFGSLTPRI